MRFFIFVYGEKRSRRFPVSKDSSCCCRILLPAEDFDLTKNIFLELQSTSGEWYVQETENYKLKIEQFFQLERQIKNESIFFRLNTERKYDVIIGDRNICIQLVCYRDDWNTFRKFELRQCKVVKEKKNIIIDNIEATSKMDVYFMCKQDKCNLVESKEKKYAEIYFVYKQDKWIVDSCGTSEVYINETLVEESQELIYGDVIYIFNCMFIFLGKYIAVEEAGNRTEGNKKAGYLKENSSNNHVIKENFLNNRILKEISLDSKVKVKKRNNNVIGEKGIEQTKIRQTENFHRAPRIMEELEKVKLHIDAPPILDIQNARPISMDIGAVINMMLPMLGMNLFLVYGTRAEQKSVGMYVYSGVFMAVMSAFCSVIWIIISRKYEEKEQKRKISRKKYNYRKYLSKKNAVVKEQYERTRKILQSRYLRAESYVDNSLLDIYLWNRNPYHKDFLMYRMGIGDMKFPLQIELPQEGFFEDGNLLWEEAREMQRHYELLHQMPVLLDMGKHSQIGIIGEKNSKKMALIRSILLQIALCNCYTEVKVACVYDKATEVQEGQWDFCRWLPHVWDSDRQKRYIATEQSEARQLFYDLFQIFRDREERKQLQLPHYILFIAEQKFLEGEMFSKYIFDKDAGYGLTVVWIAHRREQLPNTCRLVLEVNKDFCGQYEMERQSQNREKINFDYAQKETADKLIRSISGIRVAEIEEKQGIPEKIDFLCMYGVKRLGDLDVESRWEKNKIFESARVLIGKKAGGESCYLDIHERYHGPHGLLAGTTGSGKSEVLQTFILSMAVNFSPEAVNFLLIDYKGEGMSGLFAGLPHISGKISNLSDGQAYRAMISIESENKRRQTVFKKAKVNNINDYIKLYLSGQVSEPIPHLLIIIDEFAELKKAEPEFMQELISVAQVGRSLGVHLILATQKPGGVVDDKIWSNSRFRICLKVQEREDSVDMLHNVDACEITQAGRGYLQVGNNELYELFQAGWSGAVFQKEDKKMAAQIINPDGTAFVADVAYQNANEKKNTQNHNDAQQKAEVQITQLQAVSTYIADIAKKKGIRQGKKLWLEPLGQYLYLDNIFKEHKERREQNSKVENKPWELFKKRLKVCVGLFDNPEQQEQPVFSLELMNSGHIGICGRSVSGKSTFLQTFIYSLLWNRPGQTVALYLLDFNGGGMNIYREMPQVKQVIQEGEEKKLDALFKDVTMELKKRKKSFSGGNFKQYQNRNYMLKDNIIKEEFPFILIILDGFIEFSEATYQKYEEELYFILREGEKLGVIFIITTESFSGLYVPLRLSELFKTKICFYMKDTYAYTEAFDVMRIPVFPKKGVAGRGIACYGEKVLEFQTALAVEASNDYERQERIKESLKRKADAYVC